MRVSADWRDPDYVPLPESSNIQVFLDGVEQSPKVNGRAVIVADEERGEVVYYEAVEGDRSYRPFKMDGDRLAKFTAYGNVRIVRPGRVDFAALTRF